jgi:hypothetical protein
MRKQKQKNQVFVPKEKKEKQQITKIQMQPEDKQKLVQKLKSKRLQRQNIKKLIDTLNPEQIKELRKLGKNLSQTEKQALKNKIPL